MYAAIRLSLIETCPVLVVSVPMEDATSAELTR